MDIDDDDDVWQQAADFADKVVKPKVEEDQKLVDMVDAETPRLESLSVSEPKSLKRKRAGEDVFTKECVKTWQGSRIKAWESRYIVNITLTSCNFS